MTAKELRRRARFSLGQNIFHNNWLIALVGVVIASFALSIPMVGIIIAGAFMFGISRMMLVTVRTNKCDIARICDGFNEDFVGNLVLYLLQAIFVFLWSLLFIIPGIIKGYAYSMAFYIKADHPEYNYSQCLKESQRMMKGNKFRLFCLQLSFIGWMIVGALTFGIGTLWVSAYQYMATAHFYEDLRLKEKEKQF